MQSAPAPVQHAVDLPPIRSTRMGWIDNLRTFIIILVVNMHACVTYSHVGSWYVMEGPEPPMAVKVGFLFWQGHLQAFFMGLLFFLAGIFAQKSLQRRGPVLFLAERAQRLCLPALFYMLVIHPLIVFVLLHRNDTVPLWNNYSRYVLSGRFLSGNGPLWFTLALFVFSVGLVCWRRLTQIKVGEEHRSMPGALKLMVFALVLILTTFAVRVVQPIGTNILNFQLCFFPQYIAALSVGVVAGKHGWLESLAVSRQARVAGGLAVVAGPLLLFTVLQLGGPIPAGANPYEGGWHGQAFGLAAWEQLAGVGLALGLIALFRRCFDRGNSVTIWLSDRSFAVYVVHAPILVALTPLLRDFAGSPASKALALTLLGLLASYLVGDWLKRIPVLRAIL